MTDAYNAFRAQFGMSAHDDIDLESVEWLGFFNAWSAAGQSESYGPSDAEGGNVAACPFCASSQILEMWDSSDKMYCRCEKCGAYGPSRDTKSKMLDGWNRRMTLSDNSELCPFCGSDNVVETSNGPDCMFCKCEHCEASGPAESTRAQMFAAWSRRVSPSSPRMQEEGRDTATDLGSPGGEDMAIYPERDVLDRMRLPGYSARATFYSSITKSPGEDRIAFRPVTSTTQTEPLQQDDIQAKIAVALGLIDSLAHSLNDLFVADDAADVFGEEKTKEIVARLRLKAVGVMDHFGLLTDTPATDPTVSLLRQTLVPSVDTGAHSTSRETPPQARFMDEIDAGMAGEKWLNSVQTREHKRQYANDTGSQAQRVKWAALFDQRDKLTHAYLMTRDLMNWTHITFVNVADVNPNPTRERPSIRYDSQFSALLVNYAVAVVTGRDSRIEYDKLIKHVDSRNFTTRKLLPKRSKQNKPDLSKFATIEEYKDAMLVWTSDILATVFEEGRNPTELELRDFFVSREFFPDKLSLQDKDRLYVAVKELFASHPVAGSPAVANRFNHGN